MRELGIPSPPLQLPGGVLASSSMSTPLPPRKDPSPSTQHPRGGGGGYELGDAEDAAHFLPSSSIMVAPQAQQQAAQALSPTRIPAPLPRQAFEARAPAPPPPHAAPSRLVDHTGLTPPLSRPSTGAKGRRMSASGRAEPRMAYSLGPGASDMWGVRGPSRGASRSGSPRRGDEDG